MDLFIAIVCGLLYFIGTSRIGYGLSQGATDSPIFFGLIIGLMYGDVIQGLAVGATIQLVYLGLIAPGGNIPADEALAGIIAIPLALKTGMDIEVAVGIAVPFGMLGIFIDQLRRTSNAFWLHKADDYAAVGDRKGIFRCAVTYPLGVAFILRFVPVFFITYFGADAIEYVLNMLPTWIISGLSVAGGILPAMGFALIILSIGKKNLMPYFFLGFFAVAYLNINTMAAAIFGTCIALIKVYNEINMEKKGAL